jgi:hypothetical protein
MAQKTRIIYVDDLTGDELPEGQGQTVSFGLDGQSYEIELNRENADELRETFRRYVQVARRVGRASRTSGGGRSRLTGGRTSRDRAAAIREWARANGYEVNARGRIPSSVVRAYEAAR